MMRLARNNRATRSSPTRPAAVPVLAALVLLLAGVLTSCAGDDGTSTNGTETTNGTESPGYTDIGPDELAGMLENKGFLFINVHIPYEGEIPLTDLFIPYDEAAGHVDQLPDDKDAKIVVYCQSDHMLSLIHISEPTRLRRKSYAVFCRDLHLSIRRQRQMCIRDSPMTRPPGTWTSCPMTRTRKSSSIVRATT